MQVGTYPTRNFAQSCYAPELAAGESFLVPLTSACRHAARTISFSNSRWRSGVWPLRILSSAIHLTSQLSDPSQPSHREVIASLHEVDDLGKTFEARTLHRPQWFRSEEWHHSFGQLLEPPDAEFHAVAVVDGDLAASKEVSKLLEEGNIPSMLHHAELWKDLPADFHRALPIHANVKHPSPSTKPTTHSGLRLSCWLSAPFGLSLMFRVPTDSPDIPAYSRMQHLPLLTGWARDSNLRTVHAVTAHVLRGGALISVALCMSPCRSDHIIPRLSPRVWRMVSEDSRPVLAEPFLLIARTSRIVTAADVAASTGGSTGCSSK